MAYKRGYSTRDKYPRFRVERRIKIPKIIKRPLRFQIRSIIKHEELVLDTWWFTLHRRGPHQDKVGEDPLEARAVPHSLVRGTLPERIIYKYLVKVFHFVEGAEFSFQSSLQGGRIDTGGIVADFMFQYLMIILQIQGPTHNEYIRIQKDREQKQALEEMGYQVYDIWEDEIYDEYRLETRMRKIFGWYHSGGADTAVDVDAVPDGDGLTYDRMYESILNLRGTINGIFG